MMNTDLVIATVARAEEIYIANRSRYNERKLLLFGVAIANNIIVRNTTTNSEPTPQNAIELMVKYADGRASVEYIEMWRSRYMNAANDSIAQRIAYRILNTNPTGMIDALIDEIAGIDVPDIEHIFHEIFNSNSYNFDMQNDIASESDFLAIKSVANEIFLRGTFYLHETETLCIQLEKYKEKYQKIIAHLRGMTKTHFHGCWAIDLLRGNCIFHEHTIYTLSAMEPWKHISR
jgi:hypothetical protein